MTIIIVAEESMEILSSRTSHHLSQELPIDSQLGEFNLNFNFQFRKRNILYGSSLKERISKLSSSLARTEKFRSRASRSIVRNRPCWEREIRARPEVAGKKTREKRLGNSCAMAGLDYTATLASSMEKRSFSQQDVLLSSFFFFHFARVDPRRNRTKGTLPIAPQRLPHRRPSHLSSSASSLQPPSLFFPPLVLLHVPPVPPATLCLSRRANLVGRYVRIDSSRDPTRVRSVENISR